MKRLISGLFIFLWAVNLQAQPLTQLVFFGDSLSDNGNLYDSSFQLYPPSPPYFKGRFSNGPSWAENVGEFYKRQYGCDYKIYAWGGATAAFHWPSRKFIAPTTLKLEVYKYLLASFLRDRSTVLFVIWIGVNDYIFFSPPGLPSAPDKKVIAGVTDAINLLIAHGAKQFLVMNLTDASITPFSQARGSAAELHKWIVLHNQNLGPALEAIQKHHPELTIDSYDAYRFFNDYVFHSEKYNRRFHVNLTDNKTPCLQENFSLKSLIFNRVGLGKASSVCEKPNDHIYWDSIHPSETFHYVLAQLVIEKLRKTLESKP